VALVVLTAVSTGGYMVLEHYDFLNGFFFTVITLSTVGYSTIHPLDRSGQVFTIAVIATSFAGLLYAASTLTNLYTSGAVIDHLRNQRGRRMRSDLEDHVIVVGFGRVGQAVARGVVELGRQCLVIERSKEMEKAIGELGCVPLIGDATAEADLHEAAIDRAAALVAATEEDATNLIIVLTARAVRSDLRIVSRVNEGDWQDRMVRAGANVAQSPYPSYGLSLAATAVSSTSVELHTLPALGFALEEIAVEEGSRFIGMHVAEISSLLPNIVVMGLRRNATFHRWHEVASEVTVGDIIVALGPPEGVRDLATLT
jgi:voltage-gated potassium channel